MNKINYDEIFDKFTTSYIGKEIKKDVILDKLSNNDDKEIMEKFITNIFIMYSVKAEKINKKAEENFEEIQILEINISDYRAVYDIYGILLSIIPYPILAIFKYNNRVSFAVSNRILAEDKNNKGKIYTSYFIKEEKIYRYLKIDIDNCQTMIEVYNKWISNIEDAVAYYERLDRVMEFIEIGLHIKSNEVLEKLESYIVRACGIYNMKPKEGWETKLEKYSDSSSFVKKVETHILWEYLSENTFLKNKLEDFSSWSDFKADCAYNNSLNDIYYSQYNSRMSDNYEIDNIYDGKRSNKRYPNHNANIKVEIIKCESKQVDNTEKIIQDIVEEVKEKETITSRDLVEILTEKFSKINKKTINKLFNAFEKNNIQVLDDEADEVDTDIEFSEYQKNENNITLEYNYVFKEEFLNRNERYGLVGYLEKNGISVLEKDEFCMKIINRETGQIIECNHTPLYLINDILKEQEMDSAKCIIVDWKLHLSGTTEENIKDIDTYMRLIKMPYSIYQNNKLGKKIIIEYTSENIKFQKEKNPLYQYINKYIDINEKYTIIQLNSIQPNIMMNLSNVLYLLANNNNIKYRDYIVLIPERKSFGDAWHYSIKNNIKYIYILCLNISKITDNIIKQIEDYFLKFNVKYYIEKKIDDIILTMYPRKVEVVDFILDILESNNIEYELDYLFNSLDNMELDQTSLWMFETTKENKEEISKILSEPDQKRVNILKDLGAPEIIMQHELAPLNCNYGLIVDSSLQSSIESILQLLKLKYSILDIDEYVIKG